MTTTNSSPLAQAMATAQGKCEFCEKTGLAILPVRPAIMHPDSGAPQLPKALQPTDGDGGKSLPLEGPGAQYTGRVLRNGYLYVYDERGTWDKYWITEQGYLMKTPANKPMNAAYTIGREPCDKSGHKEIAACITVNDPKNAKRIWVAFSDAEWTPRVLTLNQDEAYRKRHMRMFDVKAWMGSHKAQHAQTLDTVASVVAEYAPKTKVERFGFSPQQFRSRASTKDLLVQAAAALGPGPGALLFLDDPVGVASDIALRMADAHKTFMAQEQDRERKLGVTAAIKALQSAVMDRSQLTDILWGDQLEEDSHWQTDEMGRPTAYISNVPKIADPSAAELKRVASSAWTKYMQDYRDPAMQQWYADFDREYAQFYSETVLPLARSHSTWVASDAMWNYLDCTHDGQSAEAGLVYTRVLTMCVRGTEDHKPCGELYVKWLNGVFSDQKNVLLRGIVLNIEHNRKKLIESLKPGIPWRALGWDALFATFNTSIGHVKAQAPEEIGKLLYAVSGSITRMLQAEDTGSVRSGAAALGMVSGRAVTPVELTGRYEDFRTALVRQLLSASGAKGLKGNDIQREVTLAMRRLRILGEPMKSPASSKFLALIDQKTLGAIPEGVSKKALPRMLASAIVSPEAMKRLDLRTLAETGEKTAAGIPFVGNVVAAAFQVAAFCKVSDDLAHSMSGDASENAWRLRGAKFAIGSTTADTLAKMADVIEETSLLSGRGVSLKIATTVLDGMGRFLGIAGAAIGAYWDGKNAVEAFDQKNLPLAITLGISAASGGATGLLLALDGIAFSTPVGLLIVTFSLFVAAGMVAPYLQDDNIDKWLKKCYWGILGEHDRYQNQNQEMQDLKIATGA